MASEDWRLRIELPEQHESLLERVGVLDTDADELAGELRDRRLAVTHDGDTIFVYADSSLALEGARRLIDDLKASVPVWKRQVFTEGDEEWVGTP